MGTAFEIESRYGLAEALYFVEALKKTGIEQYSSATSKYLYNDLSGFFQLLDEPYNLDLHCLIDYTFVDTFSQGITRIDADFWQTYEKYLKMQIKSLGEVKDKYPRYLMTAHDVMALNLNLFECLTDENFTELMAEVRDLAHEDKAYSIVVPVTARQIAEEGIALSHCIGSNAERIVSGDQHILFLRSSNAKEQPLVTLRLNNDRITGAEGLNRRGLTADERKFLERWGKAKDVRIAA